MKFIAALSLFAAFVAAAPATEVVERATNGDSGCYPLYVLVLFVNLPAGADSCVTARTPIAVSTMPCANVPMVSSPATDPPAVHGQNPWNVV